MKCKSLVKKRLESTVVVSSNSWLIVECGGDLRERWLVVEVHEGQSKRQKFLVCQDCKVVREA